MSQQIVVVVDAVPKAAFTVAREVATRGHVVDMLSGAIPALGALSARRKSNIPATLVLANYALPDLDAATFFSYARERGGDVRVVFYADLVLLPDNIRAGLESQGAGFMPWPIDTSVLEGLLEGSGSSLAGVEKKVLHGSSQFGGAYMRTPTPGTLRVDGPEASGFRVARTPPPAAGTSSGARIARPVQHGGQELPVAQPARTPLPGDSSGIRSPPPAQAAPAPLPVLQPPSAAPPPPPPPPPPPDAGASSSFRRRSVTDVHPGKAPVAPAAGGTGSFTRRTVAGRTEAHRPGQSIQIACPACQREFIVERRLQAYSIPCVACGHHFRIDP